MRQRGFGLIDILVATAIAAVLVGIALPSFEGQLRKARRADALSAVLQIQGAQERLRSRGTRYGDLAEIGAAEVSGAGHYRMQVTAFDADGYTLLVSATGAQAGDADCRFMRTQASGMNLRYASGADRGVGNAVAANRRCWSL